MTAPAAPAQVLAAVESAWLAAYGPARGRGSVSFVGAEQMVVLRFGPDDVGMVRYATVGTSRYAMSDPADPYLQLGAGPRAELLLTLRGRQDAVLRSLAAVASAPAVEGLVLAPDATVDTGQELWPGAAFTGVLIAAPELPDVVLDATVAVRLLPVVPVTPAELAYRRRHGAAGLRAAWVAARVDVRALTRAEVVSE